MADGLAVAASIISLIQLAGKIASLAYGYIGELKRAPNEFRQLLDELHLLEKALMSLEDYTKKSSYLIQPGLQHPNTLEALHTCFQDLEQLIPKLEPMGTRKSMREMRYLKWPLGGKQIRYHISVIKKWKNLFVFTTQRHLFREIEPDQNPDLALQDLPIRPSSSDFCTQEKITLDLDTVEDAGESKRIFEWLCRTESGRHLDIRYKRHKRTGDWLLEDPGFQGWVEGQQGYQLLWGYGIPGSGKTFLCSMVIDYLGAQVSKSNFGLAYIYFNYQDQDQQEPLYILASLVEQLARRLPHLFSTIGNLYSGCKRPTLNELYNIIIGASRSFHRVFLIFDALDECDQNQRKVLLPLFRRMENEGISIFLTSRSHPEDIQDFLRAAVKVEISAKGEDIGMYIRQKIDEVPRAKRLVKQGKCRDKIISELVHCAKGMYVEFKSGIPDNVIVLTRCRFLLVRFHIDYICQQTTIKQILIALERIRTDSAVNVRRPWDPTYDRAVENIQKQNGSCLELAKRVLMWVIKARRALTVEEIQIAVSVEPNKYSIDEFDLPDKMTLVEVCAGLVTIGEHSNTVHLAHYTVREYLLRSTVITDLENAEFRLATTCVTYLSFDILGNGVCKPYEFLQDHQSYHFLDYTTRYLSSHLRSCDETSTVLAVLKFLASSGNISTYLRALHTEKDSKNYHEKDSPFWNHDRNEYLRLHVASAIGHLKVVRLLLEGAKFTIPDNNGWNLVSQARSSGHDSVVALLLDNTIDSDLSTKDNYGQTALHVAAAEGHDKIVRLFLEKGADPSASDKAGQTVLHKAAWGGHVEVVQLLLEKGANISTTSGADVSILDKEGKTALCLAVSGGHEGVIRVLIENGADISAIDYGGWTLVPSSDLGGFETVVQTLLASRTDFPDGETSQYTTLPEGHKVLSPAPCEDKTGSHGNWRWVLPRWLNSQSVGAAIIKSSDPPSSGKTPRPLDDNISISTHNLSDGEWEEEGEEEERKEEEEEEEEREEEEREEDEGGYQDDEMCWEITSDDDDSPYFNSYSEFGMTYCAGSGSGGGRKRGADFFQGGSEGQNSLAGGSQNNDQEDRSSDQHDKRRRKKNEGQAPTPSSIESQSFRFACPFFKNDAEKYASCAKWNTGTIHRVKEHCKRAHLKPLQCLRCGIFRAGDQGQINAHFREGDCEKAVDIEPVEDDVINKGRALQPRSLNWKQIYIILFPGCVDSDVPDPRWKGDVEAVAAPAFGEGFPPPQIRGGANSIAGFATYLISQIPRLMAEYQEIQAREQLSANIDSGDIRSGHTGNAAHYPPLQLSEAQPVNTTSEQIQIPHGMEFANNTPSEIQSMMNASGSYIAENSWLPPGQSFNFFPNGGIFPAHSPSGV